MRYSLFLHVVAALAITLIHGCGGETVKYVEVPTPTETPSEGGSSVSWAQVEPIIKEQCALSGCHAGTAFVSNGAAFKASSSKIRVANGSMPPRNSPNFNLYSRRKRDLLLEYLK